jgi:serine/threonine protein kinase
LPFTLFLRIAIFLSPSPLAPCVPPRHPQDIFSLGLVLFEVLTGAPLFCSDAEAAAVYRDLSAPALRRKAGAVFIEHCVRRRLNELGVTDRTLRDFLYRALQFAPHLRPTAARMAQHPLLPRV